MWVGKFALSPEGLPAGGVAWVDLGTTAAVAPSVVNGAAYHPTYSSADDISALYVTTEAVAASDTYIGGFRYRKDGTLRVYDATSAVPAGSNTNQGIALTSDGQLCYTTGNTTSFSLNGVAVDKERRVYAAPLAFELQFADAGAGVVTTTEAITAATPTFTRATTATTVLSTGLIGSVASGSPRSYYDPTSLTYLGYLAEGARTNICLQSEAFNTTWTNVNSTESVNAAIAPDGATTADLLIPDGAATDGGFLQTGLTLSAAATYTLSVFAKTSVLDSIQLRLGDVGFTNSVAVTYNTTTGAVESAAAVAGTWTAASSTAKQYPNGWWRFTVKATATTNAGDRVSLTCTDTGDGTNGILLWGAQIEAAAFETSYIPTTTLAVARNADVLTYPTTGWLNAAAGTLFAQGTATTTVATKYWAALNDGTQNNVIAIGLSTATAFEQVVDGSVAQANYTTGSALAAGAIAKVAAVYAANDFAAVVNGGTVATDSSGTIPTVDRVGIGNISAVGQSFGPIRRVAYFSARLANATLVGLTA